jgi:hypothetical protein
MLFPDYFPARYEPAQITAGQTLSWTKTVPNFPATSYTLKYALQAGNKPLITIVATASGSTFAVAVTAAISAAFAPGVYTWTAFVEDIPDAIARTIIARGTISILPSPLQALGTTHCSRMLQLIEQALEGRIPNGLESTEIDGQRIDRIPVRDLKSLRDKYRAEVMLERNALAEASGQRRRNSIGIKFVRP